MEKKKKIKKKINLAVIGNGGREHALCYKFLQSKKIKNLYCIPGNAGTETICKNLNIDYLNFDLLYKKLTELEIFIVFVGPEIPLVAGIVDFLSKRNIFAFGPSKKASQLEGSKAYMKKLCSKFNIPTAKYKEFKNLKLAKNFIMRSKHPLVIKSDGLAAGKGVTICHSKKDSLKYSKEILQGRFKTSSKLIIEEFLEGEEASYFVITDGKNFLPIGTAQDHKKIGEGDTGPNTGGMGAYSPSLLVNNAIEKKIQKLIIEPTIKGMNKLGNSFVGILYAGLMIKGEDVKLIEYNIRFGDPECQVLMMRLKNDLLDLILSVKNKKLTQNKIIWKKEKCLTVVASSQGYPNEYKNYVEIKNIKKIKNNNKSQLFHAGTIFKNNSIFSNGGRVLNATSLGKSFLECRNRANKILEKINWAEKYFRKDIGWRVINDK